MIKIMQSLYITVFLTLSALPVQAQHGMLQLKPEDELIVEQLIKIDSTKGMDESRRKEVFNSFQAIINKLLNTKHQYIQLLKTLIDKQIALFPNERKPYIDAAKLHYNISEMDISFDMAYQSMNKKSVLYEDPSDKLLHTARTMMGQYYNETNQFQNAHDILKPSVESQSSPFALTYIMFANTAFNLKNYEDCVSNYSIGFSKDARQAAPRDFFFFGVALHKLSAFEQAEMILKVGCKRFPTAEGLHLNLGYVLRTRGRMIESIFEFHAERLVCGPESAFYIPAGENIKITENMITEKNNDTEVIILNNLRLWNQAMEIHEYETALENIKTVQSRYSAYHWFLWLCMEQTYVQLQQYDKALELLNQMEINNPGLPNTYVEKVEVYTKSFDYVSALDYLKQVQQNAPDHWKVKQLIEKMKLDETTLKKLEE
ncbi:MAG: tetratricopeptide repeat protein [Candidatus Auribacter fodinae]|uniref:Tetratricopeptide repeat protein n=1 Tax=Candidatus Auribacter fodinae TaxID=2093366 RepID=A0A3A4R960_9BACT|nr:MAG: tetratricopeptide repeat protein [Candidatus Auribacter fodinae]